MRQRIDTEKLYAEAAEEVRAGMEDSAAPQVWPDANPFTLNDLLAGTTSCCWGGWRMRRLDALNQPTWIGTSVMVSLPKMSMTFTATV